jgi:hypothetical protein
MSKLQKRNHNNNKTSFVSETNSILNSPQVDNRIYRRRLVAATSIITDVVGTHQGVITMDPSSATDWSSCSSLYDEFRVVGIKITLASTQTNTITKLTNLGVMVYDNDDVTALTTYGAALDYQDHFYFPYLPIGLLSKSWSRPSSGKSTAVEWSDIGAPSTSKGSVKFFADNLTASQNYFTVVIEWAVEFRGIR